MSRVNVSKSILQLADWLLHALHIAVMLFCITGWFFPETRNANLLLIVLIAMSWFGLGAFFGYGYCAITALQWRIKNQLGDQPETGSFVKYQLDSITGRSFDENMVNKLTQVSFYVSALASLYLSYF